MRARVFNVRIVYIYPDGRVTHRHTTIIILLYYVHYTCAARGNIKNY